MEIRCVLKNAWPLTLPQQDIYLDALNARCGARYNVGGYIELGGIDPHRLAESHARLVARQEIFGLRIVAYNGSVLQTISNDRNTALPLIDFSLRDDPESTASGWLDELFRIPLEIEEAELFRSYLLKLGENQFRYVGIAHHIALDGWGFSNWARELACLYASDTPAGFAESWRSAAIEEQSYLQGSRFHRDRAYWREQFPRRPQATFSRRPYAPSGVVASGRVTAALSAAETKLLASVATAANASPSHVLLSALLCCFAKYSGMESVCIGLPFHNRKNAAQKQMLGVFVGVNLLRVKVDDSVTCLQLIERVGSKQREALRHRQYPIGLLVRDLDIRGENRRLYDLGFNYLRFENDLDFGGKPATLHYVPNHYSSTPLMLTAWESTRAEPLRLHLDFSHEYFSELDAARTLRRVRQILGEIVTQPERAVGDLTMILNDELDLLRGPGSGLSDIPADSIVSQLQRQIALRPDAVAAIHAGRSLTFRQLGATLEVAAQRIAGSEGVAPSRIAVCLPRGFALVATLFGVWRLGATVMLIDPEDDVERTEYMLERGEIQLLVTDSALMPRFAHRKLSSAFIGPGLIGAEISPSDRAGRTSTATGGSVAALTWAQDGLEPPRLAEVSHAMLERLVQWACSAFSETELTCVLTSTRLSNSASLFEWVVPLCLGRSIVIGSERGPVTCASLAPSLIHVNTMTLYRMLVQGRIPPSVAAVSVHGKAPSRKLIDELARHRPDLRLVQTSGGAEHCYCAIATSVRGDSGGTKSLSQHRLLECVVLSRKGDQIPIGWTGELYVTAPSHGARSRERRNKDDTHRDPDTKTRQRTGLLAKVTPVGTIEIVASTCGFAQSNGYLLDLAEIERQAEMVEGVGAAVARVISDPAGDELVLLVTNAQKRSGELAGGKGWIDRIRQRLGAQLPSYMVPARIEIMEEQHLGSDLSTFADDVVQTATSSDGGMQTKDAKMEEWLVREWATISDMSVEDIDPRTRFLAIGASLHAIVRFANRISTQWQVDMSPADVVDETSLRSLTRSICALLALRKFCEAATKIAVGDTN
jgi:non-ribosomal peptide synthetase component F